MMTAHDQDFAAREMLKFMHGAVNYNGFLERELLQFLGEYGEAIDFGAGEGKFAAHLAAHGKRITAIEPDPQLRKAIAAQGLAVTAHLEDTPLHYRIYSQNVLEHIEDDEAALRALHGKLHPSGKLFLYVPAFACLYTDFDRSAGHWRRYRKTELVQKLERAGFAVERAEYVDSIGFLCWLVMGKLPGDKTRINARMVRLFDRFVFPLSRMLDRITKHFFGKNLLVIARKI